MLGNLFNQRRVVPGQASSTPQESTPQQPQQPAQDQQSSVVGSHMDASFRQNMSALSHLDQRSTQVLMHAQEETVKIQQQFIEPEQVALGLLYDEEIFKLLESQSIDVAKLQRDIQTAQKPGSFTGQLTLSNNTTQIFERAYRDAKTREGNFIAPEDILIALYELNTQAATFLTTHGVKKEKLEEKLVKSANFTQGKSVLEKYGVDLTEQARRGELDPVAGRDKEVDRIVHILLRRTKNNPIIIGEAGVGKTAIVEGLAQQIVDGKTPGELTQRRIIQIDISSLVAGASHRGEFEERLRSVLQEAIASQGKIILFVDEIHTIIGTGGSDSALDASNIVKPHLARGQLQIIGTTTTAEYRKYFEKDKAFERRFQPIVAEEPSEENAKLMLQTLKPKYEKFHGVTISDEALDASVKLSKKYIGERYLPDKAVDLLDEAAADVKLKNPGGTLDKSHIEQVVSAWTGIPITKLTEDESQKLLNLDKKIHERLIDQEEAVIAVSEAVRRGRIGLSSANRPIASFIFLGPTGVGKTELAKTLAEILFGKEDAMVRLDMSEYMEKHEVAKLIGSPPGYVGYEEGGQLTEAVRIKPYSIVLLDEVEKAHPDVFNILLQLLEDGRLTDNKGNTISFKNTIIIATSNIGSVQIQQQLSQVKGVPGEMKKELETLNTTVSDELHKFFKPELLNRFDEIVIFKPLLAEHMTQIAKLGVEKTAKLLKDQGYTLSISDAAIKQLALEGFDPVYGARPLRRLIQSAIENPIALHIIGKTFIQGDAIVIDYDQTKQAFTFTKGAGMQQAAQELDQAHQSASLGHELPSQDVTPMPQVPQQAPQAPPTTGADGTQMAQTNTQ